MHYKILPVPHTDFLPKLNVTNLFKFCVFVALISSINRSDSEEKNINSVYATSGIVLLLSALYTALSNDAVEIKYYNFLLTNAVIGGICSVSPIQRHLKKWIPTSQDSARVNYTDNSAINMLNEPNTVSHVSRSLLSGEEEDRYWFIPDENNAFTMRADNYNFVTSRFSSLGAMDLEVPFQNISWATTKNGLTICGQFYDAEKLSSPFNFTFSNEEIGNRPELPIKNNLIDLDTVEVFNKNDAQIRTILGEELLKLGRNYKKITINIKETSHFFRPLMQLVSKMTDSRIFIDSCPDALRSFEHISCFQKTSNDVKSYHEFQGIIDCFSLKNPKINVIEIVSLKPFKRQQSSEALKKPVPKLGSHILEFSPFHDFSHRIWMSSKGEPPNTYTDILIDLFNYRTDEFGDDYPTIRLNLPIQNIYWVSTTKDYKFHGYFPGIDPNQQVHNLLFQNTSVMDAPVLPTELNVIDLDTIEIFSMCDLEIRELIKTSIDTLSQNYKKVVIKLHKRSTLYGPFLDLMKTEPTYHFFIDSSQIGILRSSNVYIFDNPVLTEEVYANFQNEMDIFSERNPDLTVVEVQTVRHTKMNFFSHSRDHDDKRVAYGGTPVLDKAEINNDVKDDCHKLFEQFGTPHTYHPENIRQAANLLMKENDSFESYAELVSKSILDSIPTILSRLISTPSKLTTRKDERTNELKEMKHSMNYYRGFKNLDKNGLSTLINSLIKKIFLSNIPVLTNLRAMSRLQMEFFGYKAGIPKPLAIAIIDSIKDKIEEDFGIKLMILKHRPDNYDLYTVNVNLYKQIWKRRFGTDDIDIEECVDNNRVACKLGVTQADIDLTHAEAFGFPDIAGQYYIMNDAKNRSMTGKRLQNDFRIIDVADSKLDVFFRYPKQLDQDEIDRWRTCSNLAYTFVDTEVINFKHI